MSTLAPNESAATSLPPEGTPVSGELTELACRLLDIIVSLILIVLLAPLVIIIAVAIRIDSRGPVLFRQRRLGQAMTPFTVNKFRTMRPDADDDVHRVFVLSLIAGETPVTGDGSPRYKLGSDPRVTRLGRLLRRSSLDELPQLLNVLCGQMSLVGPRPPIAYEVERYPAHWYGRFAVRPGLTGLWQVSGRSELPFEDMIRLDLEYVERRSFTLNLSILIRTIPVVLSLRGAC